MCTEGSLGEEPVGDACLVLSDLLRGSGQENRAGTCLSERVDPDVGMFKGEDPIAL